MKDYPNFEQNHKKKFLIKPRKFTFKSACIMSIISILAIVSLYGSVIFFTKNTAKAPDQCVDCQEQGVMDYEVNLSKKQNYLPDVLQSRMSYVAALIDTVTVKCNYHLLYDRNLEHTHKYKILADFKMIDKSVKEGGDNQLACFTDELYCSENFLENSKQIDVEKTVVLPYAKYNEMAKKFAEKTDIVPEAFVTLKMVVETDGKSENVQSLARESEMSLKIPLYQKTIDIDETASKIENQFTFDAYIFNVRNIALGIICLALSLTIILMEYTLLKSYFPAHSNKGVENILKNYRYLIIEISESNMGENIDLKNMSVHRVAYFEDLVSLSYLLHQPIKYYKENSGSKFCFVIDNDCFERYVYVIFKNDGSKK